MGGSRFDALTRSLTVTGARRRALAVGLGGVLATVVGLPSGDAVTAKKKKKPCPPCKKSKQEQVQGQSPGWGGVCAGESMPGGRSERTPSCPHRPASHPASARTVVTMAAAEAVAPVLHRNRATRKGSAGVGVRRHVPPMKRVKAAAASASRPVMGGSAGRMAAVASAERVRISSSVRISTVSALAWVPARFAMSLRTAAPTTNAAASAAMARVRRCSGSVATGVAVTVRIAVIAAVT